MRIDIFHRLRKSCFLGKKEFWGRLLGYHQRTSASKENWQSARHDRKRHSSCESFIKTEHASSTTTHTHTRRTTVDSHIPSTSHQKLSTQRSDSSDTSRLRDTIVHLKHIWIHISRRVSSISIHKHVFHPHPSPSAHSQGVKHLPSSTCTYQSCVSLPNPYLP